MSHEMRVDVLAPWKIPHYCRSVIFWKVDIASNFPRGLPLLFKEITVHVASLESRKFKVQKYDVSQAFNTFLACYPPSTYIRGLTDHKSLKHA